MTARAGDPFRAIGLEPRSELGDDDIRAAWRRIAAATHPDRPDGGDPAAFARAAAAYAALRSPAGRGEALADLLAPGGTIGGTGGPGRRGARDCTCDRCRSGSGAAAPSSSRYGCYWRPPSARSP